MYLKTEGLVLRQTKYQDADQILTVLTKQYGLMTLRARGVCRKSSPLKGACQLLTYSEFTVFENRGFHTVQEASVIEMFQQLRDDIELLALSSYFAQVTEVLSQEDLPNPDLLSLVLNCLYALSRKLCEPTLIKAAFEFRAASIAGYEPNLEGCDVCGNPNADRFDVSGGTIRCSCCGGGGLRLPVSAGCLDAMRYISRCESRKLLSFRVDPQGAQELSDAAETYLVTQLERGFYTLDFYKSLFLV